LRWSCLEFCELVTALKDVLGQHLEGTGKGEVLFGGCVAVVEATDTVDKLGELFVSTKITVRYMHVHRYLLR
jgi:hypothetical protein